MFKKYTKYGRFFGVALLLLVIMTSNALVADAYTRNGRKVIRYKSNQNQMTQPTKPKPTKPKPTQPKPTQPTPQPVPEPTPQPVPEPTPLPVPEPVPQPVVPPVVVIPQPITGETINVSFKESTKYFVNPYMGAVAPADRRTRYVDGSLVNASFLWKDLEPQKGVFRFDALEQQNNFDYWVNQKNNKLMLMFNMDVPLVNKNIGLAQLDIPRWLYDELKVEATANYTKLLAEAKKAGNTTKVNEYNNALNAIKNDQSVIDNFNRTQAKTANIPGVGTFYRYQVGSESRGGFSPNYASPLLLSYHNKVLQAMANRYDNDNTYAIVMGSIGHWGEMHTYYIQNPGDAGRYPSKDISSKYESAYGQYFKNVQVSLRNPREIGLIKNYGLHAHSFGDSKEIYSYYIPLYENGYRDYYTGDTHPAMKDFWKNAPSGGEFLYTGDHRFLNNNYIEGTIQQARDTRLTWFNEIFYDLDAEKIANQEYFFTKIGYRFFVSSASYTSAVQAGSPVALQSTWKNAGTAPFYKDWPIVAQLRNSSGQVVSSQVINSSVRDLFPNTEKSYSSAIQTPSNLPAGNYDLLVGIQNPTTGQAEIQLTMDLTSQNKMYKIGTVKVAQ